MSQQVMMARALYDFTGDPAVRQLSFKKNDMIKVTHQYERWMVGGRLNGKNRDIFPRLTLKWKVLLLRLRLLLLLADLQHQPSQRLLQPLPLRQNLHLRVCDLLLPLKDKHYHFTTR